MGNAIIIKDRRVCVKPLRSILEVIQKLKHPTVVKDCRSFAGKGEFCKHILARNSEVTEAYL